MPVFVDDRKATDEEIPQMQDEMERPSIWEEIEQAQAEMARPRIWMEADKTRVIEYSSDPPRYMGGIHPSKFNKRGNKHGVIGDTQIRPEDNLEYLRWIAHYFADKKPDVVVQVGDMADMASLSSYDSKAKKAVDRRSVREDFEAANRGWQTIEEVWTVRGYQPKRKVYLLGNHEQRIERFTNDNPELAGDVNYDRFIARSLGWEVRPFLEPVTIDGVTYSHFFPRGPSGRITQTKNGAPNAITMVKREMRSCTAGHMQGLDVAIYQTSERTLRGLILGSTYLHDETYLSPQGNRHWRGIALKHSVRDGNYDLCEVPLGYLEEKYG